MTFDNPPRNKKELFEHLDELKNSALSKQEQQKVSLGSIRHLFEVYSLGEENSS